MQCEGFPGMSKFSKIPALILIFNKIYCFIRSFFLKKSQINILLGDSHKYIIREENGQ